ncbi:metallophosphoesterase [Luteimicrobium sp. NPDC057192]|uniref:metallophosphoesterase n=1 Tax=Luteimicrobium sp. NPDC057192 TaxID=3346042 RepID=UPI0036359C3C
MTTARRALGALGLVAASGAAGLGYALWEARQYTLRDRTVPVLPPGQPDLTILHFSDLHLVPSQADKIAWVRDLASLRPDFVVDTGDNMAHRDALGPLLHALEPLLGTPGAFVMGSNDYYAPKPKNPARYLTRDARKGPVVNPPNLPAAALAAALSGAGWKDLTNRRDVAVLDGLPEGTARRIELVGVDDPHLDRDRFPPRLPADGLLDALAEPAPAGGSDAEPLVRLGVTHAPYVRVLDQMYDDGAELILAGHTHGGQLCVPGYGALVTNCDLDRERVSGLHGWPGARPDTPAGAGSTWLNVCAGLGTSPYTPVRFACRPEAVLLRLVARG